MDVCSRHLAHGKVVEDACRGFFGATAYVKDGDVTIDKDSAFLLGDGGIGGEDTHVERTVLCNFAFGLGCFVSGCGCVV
ncbi:hypothetical protein C5B89_18340 [Haloferax sp. Atlit-47N]|nr:hypothetical protein DEQ67_15105 [Haloferax sp. Atlit-48N]RDZ34001.1 hypothetical protein C5B88_15215 [Haloferax sp. Atlit-24N]RDZ35677.1 hypothetical protein C5B89_18340 [Haloferax sp. Atlit-47N]RLM33606.1 hypothetical protein DVK03_18290 [Haloferax sp. Atlit-109R]